MAGGEVGRLRDETSPFPSSPKATSDGENCGKASWFSKFKKPLTGCPELNFLQDWQSWKCKTIYGQSPRAITVVYKRQSDAKCTPHPQLTFSPYATIV
jgi:hypothetical protein